MAEPDPHLIDEENPEWTEEMFARARPAREAHGEAFVGAQRRPGRPRKTEPKEAVSLRLDADVVRHLRAKGPGWQTRVNEELARLIAEGSL
jgi:uncharacterized protein (DUF4415 family)